MSQLHFYHGAICTASQRVRLMLAELNLPFTSHIIDMLKQEHISETYLAINPKGLLPVLRDGDKVITESNDILEYLNMRYACMRYTPASTSQVHIQENLLGLSSVLHSSSRYIVYEFLFKPFVRKSPKQLEAFKKQQQDEALIAFHEEFSVNGRFDIAQLLSAFGNIDVVLGVMEELLVQSTYLLGEEICLADISLFPDTKRLELADYPLEPYKMVRGWLKKMNARGSCYSAISRYEPKKMLFFCSVYRSYRSIKGDSLRDIKRLAAPNQTAD